MTGPPPPAKKVRLPLPVRIRRKLTIVEGLIEPLWSNAPIVFVEDAFYDSDVFMIFFGWRYGIEYW